MLRISDTQMAIFRQTRQDKLDRDLAEYAFRRFPSKLGSLESEALLQMVRQVRARAMTFGIERQDNLAVCLDLWVMYGANFCDEPWATDILSCNDLHGPDKIVVLRHRVEESGFEVWPTT